MKKVLFLLIIVAIYTGGLFWKAAEVEKTNNKDVPTLYKYWEENGVPVFTEIASKRSLSNTVTLTGVRARDRVVRSLVAPQVSSKLKIGAIARITRNDVIYNGKVSFISKEVDQLSGLYTVEITFSKNIIAKKSLVIQVEIGHLEKSVVVKRAAVSTRGGKAHVFIVENKNKVTQRDVVLSGNNDDYYAIKSGLEAGDEIVVSDQRYLKDEQKVLVIKKVE